MRPNLSDTGVHNGNLCTTLPLPWGFPYSSPGTEHFLHPQPDEHSTSPFLKVRKWEANTTELWGHLTLAKRSERPGAEGGLQLGQAQGGALTRKQEAAMHIYDGQGVRAREPRAIAKATCSLAAPHSL